MTFKQVIWDWNGTIVNDTHLNYESACAVLKKYDLPLITLDYYRDNLRFPLTPFYENLGALTKEREFAQIEVDFYDHYSTKFEIEVKLHDRVTEILDRAAELRVEQSILSARNHRGLLEEVEHFGLSGYFSKVQGATEGEDKGKLSYASSVLSGHDPKEVVMIGDTIHDFEIADALGIHSILIAKGINSRKLLEETPAQILDSHAELIGILFK